HREPTDLDTDLGQRERIGVEPAPAPEPPIEPLLGVCPDDLRTQPGQGRQLTGRQHPRPSPSPFLHAPLSLIGIRRSFGGYLGNVAVLLTIAVLVAGTIPDPAGRGPD